MLENGLIALKITFYRKGWVRFKYIEVLLETGGKFFKPEVDNQTHKNIYFWNQTIVLITKIYFF